MAPHPTIQGFDAFQRLIEKARQPVVLLEGSREVPPEIEQQMERLAAALIRRFPQLTVRSGNAPGSDQAWARGVNSVDARRLELVLPVPNWRGEAIAEGNQAWSLREAPPEDVKAAGLLTREHYQAGSRRGAVAYDPMPAFKKPYLERDALKVLGWLDYHGRRRKATAALFYVNPARKGGGGTGHTMRLCEAEGVPFFLSEDWLEWKV